jgi:hypothetical protein
MGVHDALVVLSEFLENTNIYESFKGQTILIDISCELHAVFSRPTIVGEFNESPRRYDALCDHICGRLATMRGKVVVAFVVFDHQDTLPQKAAKRAAAKERREMKVKAPHPAAQIESDENSETMMMMATLETGQ